MIDQVVAFSKTGVVLWSRTFCSVRGDPINELIRHVLLQERRGQDEFMYGNYKLRWEVDNKRGLFYAAICQKFVPIEETDRVLALLKEEFGKRFPESEDLVKLYAQPVDFDEDYDKLQLQAEAETHVSKTRRRIMRNSYANSPASAGKKGKKKKKKKKRQSTQPTDSGESDGGSSDDADALAESLGSMELGADEEKSDGRSSNDDGDEDVPPPKPGVPPPRPGVPLPSPGASGDSDDGENSGSGAGAGAGSGASGTPQDFAARRAAKIAALKRRGRGGRRGSPAVGRKAASPAKQPRARSDRNRNRQSDTIRKNVTAKDMAALDRNASESSVDARRAAARRRAEEAAKKEEEELSAQEASRSAAASGSWFATSSIGGFFQKLAGNKVLDDEDIAPVMERMREQLLTKNVASEVADELCKSVGTSLVGQRLERLTRIATVVRTAMQDSLERILTAKRSTDVLAAVRAKKAARRGPFVVVFIGVNGVGKSTSLAKVCSFLKRNGHSVLIAACDTFRSGAVEQLRTHCDALEVDLFARGYNKDPAMIAQAAVKQATEEGTDVVLIDTAGRMQNNEPLMRALAKLVNINTPDLVLFVGEALVGNDGVDQLQFFNQTLVDNTDPVRSVDGIVLTKYDTIDDKVGAAVSMVYKTGQPIVFVGVGQHYSSLKRLDVAEVVQQLCT